MNALVKTHRQLVKKDYKELWEKGTFVFDTNVLLDLYRLPETAKNDLLKILTDEKIKDRVWLPFQVFLEFSHNRIGVIASQKLTFNTVKNILSETSRKFDEAFEEMKNSLNKLDLDKRHSILNTSDYVDEDLIKSSLEIIKSKIENLKNLEKQQPNVNDNDDLQNKILEIFADKIGSCFAKNVLDEIYKEGEERFKNKIPPGYKDAGKDEELLKKGEYPFYLYEDKQILRKFGDLLFWKEIINKAKTENLEYVVLITNDNKEGWVEERKGMTLGVRYELLNEIYFNANSVKLFHIYNLPSFMEYSKEFLKININDKSIGDTKHLLESLDKSYKTIKSLYWSRYINPKEFSFAEMIRNFVNIYYPDFMVIISSSFDDLLIQFPPNDLISLLTSVFVNKVLKYGVINIKPVELYPANNVKPNNYFVKNTSVVLEVIRNDSLYDYVFLEGGTLKIERQHFNYGRAIYSEYINGFTLEIEFYKQFANFVKKST